ncbi:MAG TPA: hypothetical protein VFP22_02855, partial [Candidatus Limnocylindrales bacterium]|nr:hypothetical protein [Candidatus Limnocylindrales bacterium]
MTQNPTTEAGRQFNEQTDGQYIEDVLAIESEARATAPAGDDPIRHATDVVIDLIERTRNDKYEPPEVSAVRATLSEAR